MMDEAIVSLDLQIHVDTAVLMFTIFANFQPFHIGFHFVKKNARKITFAIHAHTNFVNFLVHIYS